MLELLKGKRTYLTVILGLLYIAFCAWQGIHPDDRILALLGFSGIGFLRAAQPGWPPPASDREDEDDAHETVVLKRTSGGSGESDGSIMPPLFAIILAAALLVVLIAGCSTVSNKQKRTDLDTNGVPTAVMESEMRATTFWDSTSQLSKFKSSQTEKTQGLTVGELGQASTSTNVTSQLGELRDLVREIKTPLPVLK